MVEEREWLLVKRDLYFRPEACGYTGIRDQAGRYTEAEAKDYAGDGDLGVSMIRLEDAPEFTKSCFPDLARDHLIKQRDFLRAELEQAKRERDVAAAAMIRNHERAEAAERLAGARVKPLEWEDADEGMCTKWRAAALGGHYELVALDGDDGGLAVNFHWGRPLSFWFIQGEPDERGPTGPKMFPTLEDAKSAAQADYERRILSALAEPSGTQEVQTGKARKDGIAARAADTASCATEGCDRPATVRFERGNVGSYYCHGCYMRVQALAGSAE